MGHIYEIKNKINGKIYIGQTIRPIEKRLEEHRTGKSKKCRAIHNAIQKYGWENFEKDYYECPDEDLNFDEDLLVSEMKTLSPNGYNIREGGGSRGKHSEESKQKMREANLGKTLSDEHKQKIRKANLGTTHSDETKQRMRKSRLGITHSEETKQKIRKVRLGTTRSDETKQKMREAQLGKTISDETKQKMREANSGEKHPMSKRVYQYELDGTFINSFGSTEEAGRYIKKDATGIKMCARYKRKTAHKFKWSYTLSIFM